MMEDSDPFCVAPLYTRSLRKDVLNDTYGGEINQIRDAFNGRYEATPFSKKFLSALSMHKLFLHLKNQDVADINIKEKIIEFVIVWDESRGFDGSDNMVDKARAEFLRTVSQEAEQKLAKMRMEMINTGKHALCSRPRRVRDSYIQDADLTRRDAVDRVKSHIDAAVRCRVFGTPAVRTSGTVKLEKVTLEDAKVVDTTQAWKQYARPSIPAACAVVPVPRNGEPRGPLRQTPVVFHNVRDFRNDIKYSL